MTNEKEFVDFEQIRALILELVTQQEKRLISIGKRLVPHITADDLLQPQDFPELNAHPEFRYEEGVLAGLQTAQMALQAYKAQLELDS